MPKDRLPQLPARGRSPGAAALANPAAAAGRNVLFFHSGGLGDFVLTWPILLGAARVLAQSRVIAVVGGDRGKLAEQALRVEHRDIDGSGGWSKLFGDGDVSERAAKLLAKASHVVTLVADAGSAWAANAKRLAPSASVLALTPPPRDLANMHAVEFLVRQLDGDTALQAGAAGMVESVAKTGLNPRGHDPAGPALLHVGSGSPRKNWPVARWAELSHRLRDEGRRVRILLGEAERERLSDEEQADLANAADDLQAPSDLLELWFLLRGAGLYIGGDTGPTHLAAMAGLPTLALFGPSSNAAAWRPVGPRTDVLIAGSLDALPPDVVAERATAIIG